MSCVVWMWLSGWEKHSVVIKYFMTSLTWSVANFDIWRSLKTVCHISRGLSSANNSNPFLKHLYFRFEWVCFSEYIIVLLFHVKLQGLSTVGGGECSDPGKSELLCLPKIESLAKLPSELSVERLAFTLYLPVDSVRLPPRSLFAGK